MIMLGSVPLLVKMFTRRGLLGIIGSLSLATLMGEKSAMAQFFFKPKEKKKAEIAENLFKEGGEGPRRNQRGSISTGNGQEGGLSDRRL